MLKNYIKVTFRNLWKQKGYTAINIIGLSVGLAGCIIILFYVLHEISYDKHHEHADRIYRVTSEIDFSGNYMELAPVPAPMGPTLKRDYPEVEAMTRLRPRGSFLVRRGDTNVKEDNVVFADATVFDVFTIPLLYGDPETALVEPNTVTISESTAKKYFDTPNAVGKTILLDDRSSFEVTGVFEDMPVTSHFHFDFILSMETTDEAENGIWLSNNFRTYILLKEGVNSKQFVENFETIKKTYIEPQLQQFMGLTIEEFEAAGNKADYFLQPLTDIHLYSDLTGEFEPNGNIAYVYLFSGLAVFILLLACINFMNLSTARSAQRGKEVGIRKTLGSARPQLIAQFLSESLVMASISLLIALLLVEISLPFFSELAGRPIVSSYFSGYYLIPVIGGIVLIAGLLAGSYPAFLLSGFKPVSVLKGQFKRVGKDRSLRSALVVFQFSISIVIIVGLLVINKQMNYIQQKELGFEKDRVLVLHNAYALGHSAEEIKTFKNRMLNYPVFKSATISSFLPVSGYGKNDLTYWPKGEERTQDNTVSMQTWGVDEDYLETLDMELVAGRNFSDERGTDRRTVILNEAAAQRFQDPDLVGKTIVSLKPKPDGSFSTDEFEEYKVIGIVKNFHYESLRENITPLGLFNRPSWGNIAFKMSTSNATEAINVLRQAWNEQAPGQPFDYAFLDRRFDQMYRSELRVKDLMSAFSFLAVIIACLGLFGLSAYSAERRTKEIGIRKVMGATISNIVFLMSKEFVKLVLISFMIAVPVSYMVMNQWLQDFAYKAEFGITVFVIAGVSAVFVALLTISSQSLKAALTNPVESLRNE